MTNVVRLKRKSRPLTARYDPSNPYEVERHDEDDGTIRYEVWDTRPGSYRFLCGISDECGTNPYAKFDAEQIARGLNILVNMGKETLPTVQRDDQ